MTAEIYFVAMAATTLPLAALHIREQDYASAAGCAAMLWFMWSTLPIMRAMCAVDPFGAAVAHVPWIAAMALLLVSKLWRELQPVYQRGTAEQGPTTPHAAQRHATS
ncbi:MAG: hypothetical protein AAGG72_05435 [Pseudomonadota bacterium]